MKCECGFQFAGPGDYRNCQAFVTITGDSGVVCPDCKREYTNSGGRWYLTKANIDKGEEKEG